MPADAGRLIVVSNRLPVSIDRGADGAIRARPSDGGLVSALAPALRDRGGIWVGWTGGEEGPGAAAAFAEAGRGAGYELRPVALSEAEQRGFYFGFSNEVLWPLFHDLQSHCNFDPAYWQTYDAANARYAESVAAIAGPGDLVWVHDYHLMRLRAHLRRAGCRAPAAFFLHIPFPPPDIYVKLPWRRPLLEALLQYDLVAFQTPRDRRNFLDCLRLLLPEVSLSARGLPVVVASGAHGAVRVARLPIGIDFRRFADEADAPDAVATATALRRELRGRQILLGIDRLDYTKGIPERLLAFGAALAQYPELRERVTLIQVVVPSREKIPQYQGLKERIENLVGQINGQFTRPGGWVPIHYVFRQLTPQELIGWYRAADVALVTPLKDGMNLVAKEYCACQTDGDGVLVLSEFAGAAAELEEPALLVNPYAVDEVAAAINRACTMPAAERRQRMARLRRTVRRHDVFWWVDSFLRAAFGGDAATPAPARPAAGGA